MKTLLLCTVALASLTACGNWHQDRDSDYNHKAHRAYRGGYTYEDRGHWSPEDTSFRSSSAPEGRWIYERGRNQRN